MFKSSPVILTLVALAAPTLALNAAIVGNANFNSAVITSGDVSGITAYTDSVGTDNWFVTDLSRGFVYDASGGDTGEGGAFVANPSGASGSSAFNGNIRGVLQFAEDDKATTGLVSISMDVFFDDNATDGIIFDVELFAWNDAVSSAALSVGGNNSGVYNETTLDTGTVTLLDVQLDSGDYADNAWDTATVSSSLDLSTGYDNYAWRIGVLGAAAGDSFAFDNIVVVPEPNTYALLLGICGLTYVALRRRRC